MRSAARILDDHVLIRRAADRLHVYRATCARVSRLHPSVTMPHYELYGRDEPVPALEDIAGAVRRHMAAAQPDQVIARQGSAYLERWWLERSLVRSIYLHRFVGPDPDVGPHDHPWNSASLLLAGTQIERWLQDGSSRATPHCRTLVAGYVTYRPARFAHQLQIRPGSEPPITLFVTGRVSRDWGFWVERDGARRLERHPIELQEEPA